jgi:hypothetical protein
MDVDVKIKTDLEKLTFEGVALIEYVSLSRRIFAHHLLYGADDIPSLEVKEDTSQIIFNSFSLNLGDVTLRSDAISNGASVKAQNVELSSKTERAIANFGATIPAGSKAQLGVRFGAKLTGSLLGVCLFLTRAKIIIEFIPHLPSIPVLLQHV